MVNNRKVRLMTRLAIYEKEEGQEDIKLGKYYRRDFMRLRSLLNFVSVTVGYGLVAALWVIYHMDYIVANAVVLDYGGIVREVIVTYALLVFVSLMFSTLYNRFFYNRSRRKLAKYFRMLRKIRSMANEDEFMKHERKFRGEQND